MYGTLQTVITSVSLDGYRYMKNYKMYGTPLTVITSVSLDGQLNDSTTKERFRYLYNNQRLVKTMS